MRMLLALLVLLFSPSLAFGAQPEAGFVPSTIWYSKNDFYAGDTVRIYTVIFNGSEGDLKGELLFKDNGATIGKSSFSLVQGRSETVWTDWKPVAGKHSVEASIENSRLYLPGKTEERVELAYGNAPKSEKTVLPRPEQIGKELLESATEAAKEGTSFAQSAIATFAADMIKKLPEPATDLILTAGENLESLRESAVVTLSARIARDTETKADQKIATESTKNKSEANKTNDSFGSLQSASLVNALRGAGIGAEKLLLIILENALACYAILVALLLFSMRYAYQRMTARPF
ncbi:MAG: hypothetical protein V4674_03260 [Patescibacteria group bacterium]